MISNKNDRYYLEKMLTYMAEIVKDIRNVSYESFVEKKLARCHDVQINSSIRVFQKA